MRMTRRAATSRVSASWKRLTWVDVTFPLTASSQESGAPSTCAATILKSGICSILSRAAPLVSMAFAERPPDRLTRETDQADDPEDDAPRHQHPADADGHVGVFGLVVGKLGAKDGDPLQRRPALIRHAVHELELLERAATPLLGMELVDRPFGGALRRPDGVPLDAPLARFELLPGGRLGMASRN